jgi:hypothetical protein
MGKCARCGSDTDDHPEHYFPVTLVVSGEVNKMCTLCYKCKDGLMAETEDPWDRVTGFYITTDLIRFLSAYVRAPRATDAHSVPQRF